MKPKDLEGISLFDITPADITERMRYSWLEDLEAGSSPMLESVIPFIEAEAIKRLEKELINLKDEAPSRNADFYEFRRWWLNEAYHNCSNYSPIGLAGDHLSTIGQISVNILVTAAELREAIDNNNAEKSAALGMLLICEAIAGGHSIEIDRMQASKEKSYKNGAGIQSKDFNAARRVSIELAGRLWKANQNLRIGEVATEILDSLKKNASKFPTLEAFPKGDTIKTWLKEAAKAGKLTMPAGAQRRGRATKTSK